MITEIDIKKIISLAKEQINQKDTTGFSDGKLHRYLSKAFVAGIGEYFKNKYNSDDYETKFQDFQDGKGVSGEWLYDAVVVKMRNIVVNNRQLKYPYKIEVAIESELATGSKEFLVDFSKLLIVNANNKIYINGVKKLKNKESYIDERMKLIKDILKEQFDNSKYFICFVDHPVLWNDAENYFVQIFIL